MTESPHRIGVIEDIRFQHHREPNGHPERAERLRAIAQALAPYESHLTRLEPRMAEEEELLRVHELHHLRTVAASAGQPHFQFDADTFSCEESFDVARLAAGSTLDLALEVAQGRFRSGLSAVRPPGHHAESNRPMGFCLFNNVAVAAAHLRAAHGLERIAILDWDVHHGNGTQHLFEEDPGVFYASLHQWPLYPGTGAAEERGRGAGEGATLNCPLSPGTGDAEWLGAVEERVLPELQAFAPQFVLISAGFDAHRHDPLAAIELSEEAYREMTRRMLELAAGACGGRLVSVLEGGYDLEALAASVEAHLGELLRAG